ncbi:hypothetical protein [Synechococcus sp. CCY 9618]|uniref:hypothetical protein n=1 Tax=Synechococcus sp. CCY 9618 TaxID=2815602 RepID=UPI0020B2491F|nr:hypothetical protein [Synechococcus sp. CCY 9618]
MLSRSFLRLALACGAALIALEVQAPAAGLAQSRCTFLPPIGGKGMTPVVAKTVGPGKIIGNTNWNTDFLVTRPYSSYKFFFTANSSDANASYPVEGYMKFSDGSNLQVFNETLSPSIGTGRMFGPYPAVPGKVATEMNFKVGASSDPDALGYSYRISVQGCR